MRRRALACALALLGACDGSDEGTPAAAGPAAGAPAPTTFGAFPQANLVIISLDTLRADDTSVGGGSAEITPALARLAQEGVVFEHARATAPHTAPSHMSLFTSTLPAVHEVQNVSFNQVLAPGQEKEAIIVPARADVPTLAEVLKAAGFRTVGLTDGGNLNPPHGFNRGFDTYTYDLEGAADKVALGKEWLGKLAAESDARFFLFWHTYQIHAPYCPPEEYVEQWAPREYQGFMRERISALEGLSFQERWSAKGPVFWKGRDTFGQPEADFLHGVYRAGVRYTDDQVAGLFQAMRDTGTLDDSIVVVLADHGEEFLEHGRWQHETLYDECLRVPLVVRLPGGRNGGARIKTPVALTDVMPTVLELLGIDADKLPGLPGRVRHAGVSLAGSVLDGREPKPRAIVSELIADRSKGGDFERQVAIHANGMTYFYDQVRAQKDAQGKALRDEHGKPVMEHHLYDTAKDPAQKKDLIAQGGPALAEFRKLYEGYEAVLQLEKAGAGEQAAVIMSPEMAAQLNALGYGGGGYVPQSAPDEIPSHASPPPGDDAAALLHAADVAWDADRLDEARALYKRLQDEFATSPAYLGAKERVDSRAGE